METPPVCSMSMQLGRRSSWLRRPVAVSSTRIHVTDKWTKRTARTKTPSQASTPVARSAGNDIGDWRQLTLRRRFAMRREWLLHCGMRCLVGMEMVLGGGREGGGGTESEARNRTDPYGLGHAGEDQRRESSSASAGPDEDLLLQSDDLEVDLHVQGFRYEGPLQHASRLALPAARNPACSLSLAF